MNIFTVEKVGWFRHAVQLNGRTIRSSFDKGLEEAFAEWLNARVDLEANKRTLEAIISIRKALQALTSPDKESSAEAPRKNSRFDRVPTEPEREDLSATSWGPFEPTVKNPDIYKETENFWPQSTERYEVEENPTVDGIQDLLHREHLVHDSKAKTEVDAVWPEWEVEDTGGHGDS